MQHLGVLQEQDQERCYAIRALQEGSRDRIRGIAAPGSIEGSLHGPSSVAGVLQVAGFSDWPGAASGSVAEAKVQQLQHLGALREPHGDQER